MFTFEKFNVDAIRRVIKKGNTIQKDFIASQDEFTILVDGVKMTFYRYPFRIEYSQRFEDVIGIPDLLTLAAMKAFALGG